MFGVGTIGGMFIWGLLFLAFTLSFAYLVWVSAKREHGAIRLAGQLLAFSIIVLAVLSVLYGAMFGRLLQRSWKANLGPGYRVLTPEVKPAGK